MRLLTDCCLSLLLQGKLSLTHYAHASSDESSHLIRALNRANEADFRGDSEAVSRLWDEICARMMAPLTTLWIFAMSTGEGWTASILRGNFLVKTLGPNAYNCFLFHQMIGQWYIAATRPGTVS